MTIKIFVDAHSFDNGFEGSSSFIRGIYMELVKKYPNKYHVYLGCNNPKVVLEKFDKHPDFSAVKYKFSNRYLRLLIDIPYLINRIAPDIAHFQYFTPLIKNCKWHVTIHDVLFNDYPQFFSIPYRIIRNFLFRISARRSELVSTVSEYSKNRISYWYGIDLNSIVVIPNAVNLPINLNDVTPSNKILRFINGAHKYFLCVSRFEPRKNQKAILRAFLDKAYWRLGIHLIFVGEKTLKVDDFDIFWDQVVSDAKLHIHFLSDLSYQDTNLLFAHASISIYPSYAEGFGIPPLESISYGTPCICSKTTAMMDFPFPDAFFFNPIDDESLVNSIDLLLADLNKSREMALKTRVTVFDKYNWSNSATILDVALMIEQR